MMATPSIKPATAYDVEQIVNSLVLAFSVDPAVRWMYPSPQQYLKHFPDFVKVFGGKAFEHQTACYVDGYAGAALWLPPNINSDDELVALLQHTVSDRVQASVFAVFELDESISSP